MTKQQIAVLSVLLLAGYVAFCAFGYLMGRSAAPAPISAAVTVPQPTPASHGRVVSFAEPIAPFIITGGNYPTEAKAYLSGADGAMQAVHLICLDADALLSDRQLSVAEFRDKKIDLYVQLNTVVMETVDALVPPPELHGMHQNFRRALELLGASIVNHPSPDEAYVFDEPYIILGGDGPLDSAGQLAEAVRLLELAWQDRKSYLETH